MTIVMPLFLLFVLGILLLLCVEMWALLNPTSRRLALGVVSLALGCGAHISLFYISLKVVCYTHGKAGNILLQLNFF